MAHDVRELPAPQIGLVLAGGGARGAYQVGALNAIAEISGKRRIPFAIITGVSVGAINAAGIASSAKDFRRGAGNLDALWRRLRTSDVYDASPSAIAITSAKWFVALVFGGLGVGNPCALLDNTPLRRTLERNLDRTGFARAIGSGALKAIAVTVAGYTNGHAMTYFQATSDVEEWQRIRRDGIRCRRIDVDHLMASVALPFVFSAVRIGQQYCGDGSLRQTAPLSPAIRLGAGKVLVIGVRDREPAPVPDAAHEPEYPSIGDMSGYALDILFHDNLESDIERLTRINHTLDLIPEARRGEAGLRKIDILALNPSRDLRAVAREHVHEMPRTIRLLLRSLGTWGRDDRLPSYLLFEPGYLHALMDLGYADTMRRRGEIADFLGVAAGVTEPQPGAAGGAE